MNQVQLTTNWAFSTLMKYETCPLSVKLAKIDKLPQKPLPPDNPLERGNRVHDNLEKYVKRETAVLTNEPKKIEEFRDSLDHLSELYACGMATAEQNWWFDDEWEICGRDKVWLWAKLDASVFDPDQGLAVAVDYKTGKSQYKAIEHVQQLQLYAALTALKFPEAERVSAELWYLDEGHTRVAEYTQEEALKFIGRFHNRATRMYADRFFRPNPNKLNCKYCPYGPQNGTGACPVGV